MTESDEAKELGMAGGVLKRDALGRVRTTAEQREVLLGEFGRSGLSGPQFARVAGINYQTFATWRQQQHRNRKRPRLQSSAPSALLPKTAEKRFHFAQVMVQASAPELRSTGATMLRVQLSEGVHLEIGDAGQVALAVQLIKGLGGLTHAC